MTLEERYSLLKTFEKVAKIYASLRFKYPALPNVKLDLVFENWEGRVGLRVRDWADAECDLDDVKTFPPLLLSTYLWFVHKRFENPEKPYRPAWAADDQLDKMTYDKFEQIIGVYIRKYILEYTDDTVNQTN